MILIAIYVDDILFACRSQKKVIHLQNKLSEFVEIKDLGEAKYCLGIEFSQRNSEITMRQRGYVNELLQRYGMVECKAVSTPMDLGTKLTKNLNPTEEDQKLPYRELVGALTYLSITTRPDIAFVSSHLGQFNNAYGLEHWKAAKRVIRYLKGTIDVGLNYKSSNQPIVGFVDADWGSSVDDRRSILDIFFC